MRYHALAADYDGTLAHDGVVDEPTRAALERFRASGRRLVMVTGRELDDLFAIFPQVEMFDRVVAENGALVYHPATKETHTLAEPPPPAFAAALEARGVRPLSRGRVIVATFVPHEATVLKVIREQGLELQIIFNKGAVMVLPAGVNKATGLTAALADLGLSPRDTVGVGDAENDHAFLDLCECSVAVANALPALKVRADRVTHRARGAGVAELIDRVLADDLGTPERRRIHLGERDGGGDEWLDPVGGGVLVSGTSGSGKSTLTTALLERLTAAGYQYAVIDPEGDYTELETAVTLGSPQRAPLVEEVLALLGDPRRNAVVNLLGVALEHRPSFFDTLLPRLQELRSRTGRPHWLVIDEAHHLMPEGWGPADVPSRRGTLLITVHPESVAKSALAAVDTVLAVGGRPAKTIAGFCEVVGEPAPRAADIERLRSGDTLLWRRGAAEAVLVHMEPPKAERRRHSRKYAEGNLGPERSFFFRGPDNRLNLKAQNLLMFLQLADGVDDATWEFHRAAGDYSRWFRDGVKDPDLADAVEPVEADAGLSPAEGRAAVRRAVEARYTLPADEPSGRIDTAE
jgi:hydroxymethylpyrimidine pyrophosphatase-like HAD family hydrolase